MYMLVLYKYVVVSFLKCKLFHWFGSFKLQKEKKTTGERVKSHALEFVVLMCRHEKIIRDSGGYLLKFCQPTSKSPCRNFYFS